MSDEEMQKQRVTVGKAMLRHGGRFVAALGEALLCADPDNTRRIFEAFPDVVERYANWAKGGNP